MIARTLRDEVQPIAQSRKSDGRAASAAVPKILRMASPTPYLLRRRRGAPDRRCRLDHARAVLAVLS